MSVFRQGVVLSYDCSSDYISVALHHNGKLVGVFAGGGRHSGNYLLPEMDRLIDRSGFDKADIAALAITIGPGSFTSLRIGCSVAQAMAVSMGIPVFTVLTPKIMAMNFNGTLTDTERLHVISPAYKGEVYRARFLNAENGSMTMEGSIDAISPSTLMETLNPGDKLIGSGIRFLEKLEGNEFIAGFVAGDTAEHPDAANIVPFFLRQSTVVSDELILPHYVRKPEAVIRYKRVPVT